MMPREKWTDERLDDLKKKVDKGFADTKAVVADTKTEMCQGFARVDTEIRELRGEMNARFENLEARLDARFDALNRNLLWAMVTVVVALVGSNAF